MSVDHVDPVSGSRGTLQFGGTSSCFALACSTVGPAAGAYAQSSTQVLSILDYGFSVLGPAPAIVPLRVSGMYSNINPLVAGGKTNSGLYASLGQGSTGASFNSNCYNFHNPEYQELPAAFNCGVVTYEMSFAASTLGVVSVELLAYVHPRDLDPNASLISAFVDPYIEIDPVWLRDHPGYSLLFDEGVAYLATVTPVPEPETFALLVAGLAVLGGAQQKLEMTRRGTGLLRRKPMVMRLLLAVGLVLACDQRFAYAGDWQENFSYEKVALILKVDADGSASPSRPRAKPCEPASTKLKSISPTPKSEVRRDLE